MAKITDYGSLKSTVEEWLARSDLTSYIDTFIQLAEIEMYGDKDLRIRAQEEEFDDQIDGYGRLELPSDYLGLKHIYIDRSPVMFLERVSPEYIYERYGRRTADSTESTIWVGGKVGYPKFVAREATELIFGPYPAEEYNVKGIYYKRLDELSSDTDTNWYLTNAPDLYLYGALCHSEGFTKDKRIREMLPVWQEKYAKARRRVRNDQRWEDSSGSSRAAKWLP